MENMIALVKSKSLEMLKDMFAETDNRDGDEIFLVRGVIIDEMAERMTDQELELWMDEA